MILSRTARLLLIGACWQAMPWSHAAETPATASAASSSASSTPPVATVIESEGPGDMINTEKESIFTFRDKVVVTGTNLRMTCDLLVVIARRTSGDAKTLLGKQERFKSLVATGNVHIVQGGREARCGRAEIFPDDDKVVLTENPSVRLLDGTYEASGPKMTLERGQQKAIIEHPRILLPPMNDLGYDKQPEKKKNATPTLTLPKAESPK